MSQNVFIQPYAITSTIYPEDIKQLSPLLTKTIQDIAQRVNFRTIGIFEKFQVVTGEQWFNNVKPQDKRQTYRQTYEFVLTKTGGGIGNIFTINHNIPVTAATRFTRIYGTIQTPNSIPIQSYPLPYVDALTAGAADVTLATNQTQILIYTNSGIFLNANVIVVLEYLLA